VEEAGGRDGDRRTGRERCCIIQVVARAFIGAERSYLITHIARSAGRNVDRWSEVHRGVRRATSQTGNIRITQPMPRLNVTVFRNAIVVQ